MSRMITSEQPECRDLLAFYDKYNLLSVSTTANGSDLESLDDDSLLAGLGIIATSDDDITVLKHVTSREEKRAAEEIANRKPCEDFNHFKPLFSQVKQELGPVVNQPDQAESILQQPPLGQSLERFGDSGAV